MPPNYLLHENRTLYHQHTRIIKEVDIKLNKWHITIESYIENELKQNKFKKNYDPTVGSNRKPETQQAIAYQLHPQATRWQWSKASIQAVASYSVRVRACAVRLYDVLFSGA